MAKHGHMMKEKEKGGSHMKLGGGGRFKKLVGKLKAKGGVKNPKAVAASIGRKKFGKKRFQQLAAAARGKK